MTTTASHVPDELITDFDIYDPALCMPEDVIQDRVTEMARRGPVLYSTAHGGHWVVTGYEQVNEVLRQPEIFSSHPNMIMREGVMGRFLPLEVDPPDHTGYRRTLLPLFSPSRMKLLEHRTREIVTELIDGFAAQGECEFVSAFAHELPARVFLALMGLPLDDAPRFSEWTNTVLMGKPGGTEEESNQARAEAVMGIAGYFAGVIADRRDKPVDADADVITAVVNNPLDLEGAEPRALADEELQQLFFLTMIAGLHTTQGSLAWGVMHLAQHPDTRRELIDDPARLPDAIEEILRMEAAVMPGRRATRDYELGGVRLREGDQLILALCGANHDARAFPEPEELSLERKPNRHVSFGGGRHQCIGRHLARLELRVAFEELHRRIGDYELAGPMMCHPSQTRGVVAMPIRFTPEAATAV